MPAFVKEKKKKKNQSPLSTTLNPCRSASCLLFVSVPTLKKKVKKKEEEKKKERERKKKKKKRKRKKEKERGKEKEKKKPCTAQLRLSPSQSDMVFRLSCPFIHFPSFQPVGGTRRAPPGSSVRTPEGCSISFSQSLTQKLPALLRDGATSECVSSGFSWVWYFYWFPQGVWPA